MKSMYQRKRGLLRIAAISQVIVMAGAGCKSSTPKEDKIINDVSVSQALVGKNGSFTVQDPNTVLNRYAALADNAAVGATSVQVSDLGTLDIDDEPLAEGDLVLIIQMAGATPDVNDPTSPSFGSVANLNSAGRYEFAGVVGTTGTDTINLGCGLKHAYSAAGKTQVIRVPQYTNLTIGEDASVTATDWNGTVGGVVAVHAMNTITLTGDIDVAGKGFRGGRAHDGSTAAATDVDTYATDEATWGGMKGEGIAGDPNDAGYTYAYGRGAMANAGGGGNSHNAGGGGGANAAADGDWTGQGVMLGTVLGASAWGRDPQANADSTGGGRGGYSYSNADLDPNAVSPGDPLWQGNNRRERGGLGGRPLVSSTSGANARLFLGGGGGAGDGNDGQPISGGDGGGLVFLIAGKVTGAGTINANGLAGGESSSDSDTSNSDGGGGGGGGGTVVVHAGLLSQIHITADGGLGGNQNFTGTGGTEAEGPGGGGGGGFVALSGTTLSGETAASVSAEGALGGTTDSSALSEFPSNGATAGKAGITNASAASLMYCTDDVAPDVIIIEKPAKATRETSGRFTFAATEANNGVDAGDSSASFVCRFDSEPDFTPCSPTHLVPDPNDPDPELEEGVHTLTVRVVDLSGNVGGEEEYTWRIDRTAPLPRIVTGPAGDESGGETTSTSAVFSLGTVENDAGADEIITFLCRLDSNDPNGFSTCDDDYSISGLEEGTHRLDVRARDDAGNVTSEDDTESWTWTIHALGDGGDDGGVEEEDAGPVDAPAVDALILADAEDEVDAEPDTAGVVLLDARPRDAFVAVDTRRDSARDTSVLLGDVARDATGDADDEAGVAILDARGDATDGAPADAKLDTIRQPDTAVVPSPDAYVPPPDAAVKPSGKLDASVSPSGIKLMGGGFCSVNPVGTPGLASLFLIAAFGLLVIRRRR